MDRIAEWGDAEWYRLNCVLQYMLWVVIPYNAFAGITSFADEKYGVCYGGGGGPQELQNIEPSTFVEIDEEPDYFFQEPTPKVFVSRKKGDNKPERKTVLDVLK